MDNLDLDYEIEFARTDVRIARKNYRPNGFVRGLTRGAIATFGLYCAYEAGRYIFNIDLPKNPNISLNNAAHLVGAFSAAVSGLGLIRRCQELILEDRLDEAEEKLEAVMIRFYQEEQKSNIANAIRRDKKRRRPR